MKTTEKKLLSNEEIASFCSQAAMLFQAGIPPVEGMAILQSDAQSPEGKAIFEEILTVCRQGESRCGYDSAAYDSLTVLLPQQP